MLGERLFDFVAFSKYDEIMEINTENAELDEVITDVDGAATLAVVELLLSPEFGIDWLEELAAGLDLELDEKQIDELEHSVTRILGQLAIPLVESLPAKPRENYRSTLKGREAFNATRHRTDG